MIKDRLISFALLLSIAFILVVSLSLNTILVVLEGYLQASFGPVPVIIAGIITDLIPLIIMVCIFAMIFRLLPDVRMAWKNTWFGAIFTTGLFAIGQHLISLYIGSSPAINLYDTAGSIMVIMLWTFYTSIIFFFGAVLTREKVLMSPEKLHTTSFAVPKQEVMSEFDQHG